MTMKNRIEWIFNSLQALDIKATPNNVSIMDGVFAELRGIYKEMEVSENGRKDGTAADPERRDNH
jgi:hypothetical protein